MSRLTAAQRQSNNTPERLAADLAGAQWGILDVYELRACGFSDHAIARRRRAGLVHLLFPAVYAWGHPGITPRGRFLAATKACGAGAAISHVSADHLWDLLPWEDTAPIHVLVPTRHTRRIDGIVVHRTRRPFKVIRFDHIPVVTPARALADSLSMLSAKDHRRAVREAMARKRVTIGELSAEPRLRRYLADGYTPTRSELEDAVLDLLRTGGFVKPDVNQPLGPYTPDFRWPGERLIIEADSREWHDNPLRKADDAIRQAYLEAQAERVLRVTWHQVIAQPRQTLTRIELAGAPRTHH